MAADDAARELIQVKGRNEPVEVLLKFTRHGPLIHENADRNRAYALRWVGAEAGGAGYLGSLAVMQSRDWKEFREGVARSWYLPSHSLVYADVEGNIGYLGVGMTPVRRGWDGLLPVPGKDGRYEWEGFVPFEKLPASFNQAPFYHSSNNDVVPRIVPDDPIPPGFEYSAPHRFDRVGEVLSQDRKFSVYSEERSELVQPSKWWESLPRPGYASLEKVGLYDAWFEVYRLTEGTYAVYEPYQFEEAISYLVLGDERAALIDSGNGIGDVKRVASALTELPITVVLTHEHYDHVGGAHLFDDVSIADHPRAVERLRAGVDHQGAVRLIEGDYVWKPLPSGVDPATWSIRGVEPTRLLEDGATVDLGGRELEVIRTPGHSPGSICILDSRERLLFTGDHFYPGPLYGHTDGFVLDDYLASNDKIAARLAEYDHVLGGHNEPWVESEVIPRVGAAFRRILAGAEDFNEDGGLRRYAFDGFDILVRAETVRARGSR